MPDFVVYQDDALNLRTYVKDDAADLVYMDPPFAVGRVFRLADRKGSGAADGSVAYVDKWDSVDHYLEWLQLRVAVAKQVLSPHGTLWLHLDHRAVHDAKCMCDRVFGRNHFEGEVIWGVGNGGRGRRGPAIAHQTLLVYSKTKDFVWNKDDPSMREEFADSSLQTHFKHVDLEGRAYREKVVGDTAYRYYADEGRARTSLWLDCPAMAANSPVCAESPGYPTQKPLKLLDRVIRASTPLGGLVVDPFCGSGTTLHAAALARRRAVGVDIGDKAIEVTFARLDGLNILERDVGD